MKSLNYSEPNKSSEPKESSEPAETSPADLLKHPKLWRAGQLMAMQAQSRQGLGTGFEQLDTHLPDGGWPIGGLTELLTSTCGTGEVRLLIPALQQFSKRSSARWLVFIDPPFTLYAPAMQALGIDTRRVLLVQTRTHKEQLWAFDRACQSGASDAVLVWPDERKLRPGDTRKLQVAARQGNTPGFSFRASPASRHSSMAELRLLIHGISAEGRMRLDILKRRGGWPLEGVLLPVAATTGTHFAQRETFRALLHQWRADRASQPAPDRPAEPCVSAHASHLVPGNTPQAPLAELH